LLLSAGISNVSAAATNTCVVAKSSSDDAITIAEAFEKCKTGGTVTFSKGTTYNLKSVVTISGLKNVNINLAGTISLPARSSSWQNGDHYIQLKGDNIKMYGGGTINGNGQAW
jgi:galacturan 1,4-alpha-galacturonidase